MRGPWGTALTAVGKPALEWQLPAQALREPERPNWGNQDSMIHRGHGRALRAQRQGKGCFLLTKSSTLGLACASGGGAREG